MSTENSQNTIEQSIVETKLLFEMYAKEIKTINDFHNEKFLQSEIYEDNMIKQLDLIYAHITNYENFLVNKLRVLKDGILQISNTITPEMQKKD
jgi:hypothetical protein